MIKKKEILVVILIVGLTILLAFLPTIISNTSSGDNVVVKTSNTSTITITVKGEISKEEITMKIPYGETYGYILNKIIPYLNDYSVVDSNRKKRYYEDTVITIESSDVGNSISNDGGIIETDIDKININTASAELLKTLYGIGSKRAETIIEYRNTNGKIQTFEELKSLLGVSDEVIKSIKEKAIL